MNTSALSEALQRSQHRLVLAESCTGGMVSAILAQIPGISQWLCGSAVTYRSQTKTSWLSIPDSTINQYTAESPEITQAMCEQVLRITPEATVAAAVTGHLGPNAPDDLDGIIFIAVARRINDQIVHVTCLKRQLSETERVARQIEASRMVVKILQSSL